MSDLKKRYGDWENSDLATFCAEANRDLIEEQNIAIVVFFGISMNKTVARLYNLTLKDIIHSNSDKRKIAEVYQDSAHKNWVIFAHPNSRGLSSLHKEEMKDLMHEMIYRL